MASASVTKLTDLNRETIKKILQDFYKDPSLRVTKVSVFLAFRFCVRLDSNQQWPALRPQIS